MIFSLITSQEYRQSPGLVAYQSRILFAPLSVKVYYTINDIYTLPDGERAELIEGKLYNMAPPSRKHQYIIVFLQI